MRQRLGPIRLERDCLLEELDRLPIPVCRKFYKAANEGVLRVCPQL